MFMVLYVCLEKCKPLYVFVSLSVCVRVRESVSRNEKYSWKPPALTFVHICVCGACVCLVQFVLVCLSLCVFGESVYAVKLVFLTKNMYLHAVVERLASVAPFASNITSYQQMTLLPHILLLCFCICI